MHQVKDHRTALIFEIPVLSWIHLPAVKTDPLKEAGAMKSALKACRCVSWPLIANAALSLSRVVRRNWCGEGVSIF